MDNVAEYGIAIEFENKRRLFRELQEFEKKFNKINNETHKAELRRQKELLKLTEKNNDKKLRREKKTNSAIERDNKKSADAEKRAKDKAQREEQRRLQKQRVQQAKFNQWKLRQFRSASYARLTLEQKMNIKSVLNSKKTEEEIREEYAKTTSHYARELKQRAAYERKQHAKNRTKNADGGKGSSKDGKSGTMLPIAMNPALAIGAGVALSGMAVKQGLTSGQQRYERLQQGADQTGISVDDLQRRSYISQGVSEEFNLDKQIDMLSDTQEKIGEALSEGSFNKEGEFTGGGSAGDLINALVRSGALEANKSSIETYFADADKDMGKMIDRIFIDVNANIKDEGSRRFVLESLASDWGKLNSAMNQNQDKIEQLTKSYDQNNIGLTDEDIKRLQKADSMFATISATLSNFSLKFYNGFTKAFGDDTQGKMAEFFNALMKLAEPLGQFVGLAIQPLLNHLGLLTKALGAIVDGVKWAIEAFNTVSNKIREFGANVLNIFSNLADKIKGALVGMLPSWMQSGDDKKQSSDVTNSNDTPTQVHGYEANQTASNPFNQTGLGSYKMNLGTLPTIPAPTVPTVPTVPAMPKVVPPKPTAASTQQMNNVNNVTVNPVVNTTVELDGEVIGNVVSKTDAFHNSVYTTMQPVLIGGL